MSNPIIPGGYVLLSRKLIDSEIFRKPPLYAKVWIYLLLRAQHQSYKQLKRSQLVTSIAEIMEACSWYSGFRKVTPTRDQVRGIIDWLRKPNEADIGDHDGNPMISTRKITQNMVITIANYDLYQNPDNYVNSCDSPHEKNGDP